MEAVHPALGVDDSHVIDAYFATSAEVEGALGAGPNIGVEAGVAGDFGAGSNLGSAIGRQGGLGDDFPGQLDAVTHDLAVALGGQHVGVDEGRRFGVAGGQGNGAPASWPHGTDVYPEAVAICPDLERVA